MSILVADSGSTKTAWILLTKSGQKSSFETIGINPNFSSSDEMVDIIKEGIPKEINTSEIHEVFFYGTGCGQASRRDVVNTALQSCFKNAEIEVSTDILAAARASLGDEPGVACILGTGSNTCMYDGQMITQGVPSMGFALADEGSGGYFGKKILNSYFYNIMPEDLREWLEQNYDMKLESVLDAVYLKPRANKYVAGFTKIIGEFRDHPFIQELVRDGFTEFADRQIGYLGDLTGTKIGFVGTIADVHRDILEDVLQNRGMILGSIVKSPVERLADYHSNPVYK